MTDSHRNPEYEREHEEHPHYGAILTVLLILGMLLTSGCAALQPIGEMLLSVGIEKAEDLVKGGKKAIDAARERLDAIPDEVDRITAQLEIMRAEQMYQTGLMEYLVSCHPPEMPEAQPSASAVSK